MEGRILRADGQYVRFSSKLYFHMPDTSKYQDISQRQFPVDDKSISQQLFICISTSLKS